MLWAQCPGGSNRTTAGEMPRGLQPRSSNQQRSPGWDRSVRPRPWRRPNPNLAYYLVVNVRWFFADFGKKAWLRPAGVAGVEPTSAGLEPAVRSAGLHPFEDDCSVVFSTQERKRAAPFRKRLLNETRPVEVLVMPSRAPPGGDVRPVEGLRFRCRGRDAPARGQKALWAF